MSLGRLNVIGYLALLLIIAWLLCQQKGPGVPYHSRDQDIVRQAYLDTTSNGKMPYNDFERMFFPVVVQFPSMQCVGLNVTRNALGGDLTLCYDRKTHHLISYHSNGD